MLRSLNHPNLLRHRRPLLNTWSIRKSIKLGRAHSFLFVRLWFYSTINNFFGSRWCVHILQDRNFYISSVITVLGTTLNSTVSLTYSWRGGGAVITWLPFGFGPGEVYRYFIYLGLKQVGSIVLIYCNSCIDICVRIVMMRRSGRIHNTWKY